MSSDEEEEHTVLKVHPSKNSLQIAASNHPKPFLNFRKMLLIVLVLGVLLALIVARNNFYQHTRVVVELMASQSPPQPAIAPQ